MGNIGKATEPCISTTSDNQPKQVTDIFLAVPSSLTSEMIRIRNLYRLMYRQHVYDWEKRRGDCLMKWLIMLGFMDLRGPRVCRRSTPVLFPIISFFLLFFTLHPIFSFFLLKPPINSSFLRNATKKKKKCTTKNMHLPHNMCFMIIACTYK